MSTISHDLTGTEESVPKMEIEAFLDWYDPETFGQAKFYRSESGEVLE